jgi:quinolinate synthase
MEAVALEKTAPRSIEDYVDLGEVEIVERIGVAKKALGERLVILGHHYQRDDVIRHADVTGDSFKLAQMASKSQMPNLSSFAAFTSWRNPADILSAPHQKVILPDLAAGCSMADMARLEQVETAWEQLNELGTEFDHAHHLHELSR